MTTTAALRPTNPYAANIWKFYLYRAVRFPLIWAAIYVVYFQNVMNFSLTQIGLLDMIFWLSTALGELPTGMIADRYGRKFSIVLGTVVYVVAISTVAFANSFWLIAFGFVLWGVAVTLGSGADEALLFESLRRTGRTADYPRATARGQTVKELAGVLGALAGGALALMSLSWPYYASIVLGVLTLFVAFSFTEPSGGAADETPHTNYRAVLGEATRLLRERPDVAQWILYLAVVPVGPLAIAFIYLQPYVLAAGFEVGALGPALMVMRLASTGGFIAAPGLASRLGTPRLLVSIPIVMTAALVGLLLLAPSVAGIGLILVVSFAAALATPLVFTIVQQAVTDRVRATVISLHSLLLTLFSALMAPLYGYLADTVGLGAVFGATALLLVAYGAFALVWRPRPRS